MKNNNIETTKLLERIDTKVFFMIVGLMLFSMYFPYNHNIAIVYQVMALILGVWCCKKNSCGIAFVLGDLSKIINEPVTLKKRKSKRDENAESKKAERIS